eukprot:g33574.t1
MTRVMMTLTRPPCDIEVSYYARTERPFCPAFVRVLFPVLESQLGRNMNLGCENNLGGVRKFHSVIVSVSNCLPVLCVLNYCDTAPLTHVWLTRDWLTHSVVKQRAVERTECYGGEVERINW